MPVIISPSAIAPAVSFLLFALLPCLLSGNGETRSGGAGWPDPNPGLRPWPAHISEQRWPRDPECLGGNLTARPAALPASQWPPAQLLAQRQHIRLWERWVADSLCSSSRLVKSQDLVWQVLSSSCCIVSWLVMVSVATFFSIAHSRVSMPNNLRHSYSKIEIWNFFFTSCQLELCWSWNIHQFPSFPIPQPSPKLLKLREAYFKLKKKKVQLMS